PILEGILVRVLAGLLPACSSLDEEAARQMVQSMAQVQQALKLLQRDDLLNAWLEKLQRLLELSVHGLVRGWCSRKLLEQGKLSDEAFHRLARLSLSPAREPMDVAAWATGLLQGSGMVLLHHEELWQSLDRWLMELPEVTFTQMLPLLRRAFADFTPRERQAMGEKIKHLRQQLSTPASYNKGVEIHEERAQLVLPVLREILGVK
ncbi:MAG TPA: DUF5682 family protein, partial [Gemmatales bacterium]|nr:DUF5682 family protein [Gemmatales bacterium]